MTFRTRLAYVTVLGVIVIGGVATTNNGTPGTWYAARFTDPWHISYEGSYAKTVAWSKVNQGEWNIGQLPKGFKHCNPAKRVCPAP